MIDKVLVTMRYKEEMEIDMELPAQIEISVLCEMLLEVLYTLEPKLFSDRNEIALKHNGKIIEKDTLYENKIWDGSILEIV